MAESPHFKELLQCLNDFEVRYLIVGGYAVMKIRGATFHERLGRLGRTFDRELIACFRGAEEIWRSTGRGQRDSGNLHTTTAYTRRGFRGCLEGSSWRVDFWCARSFHFTSPVNRKQASDVSQQRSGTIGTDSPQRYVQIT